MKETKLFGVRIPLAKFLDFEKYLNKYSYGETIGEKFNAMIDEILRLDKEEQTQFFNFKDKRAEKAKAQLEQQQANFGEVNSEGDVCVRFPYTFKQNSFDMKKQMCTRCRSTHPNEFKACQEIRKEKKLEDIEKPNF